VTCAARIPILPANDETVAEIYQKCGTPASRRSILNMVWENVNKRTDRRAHETYSSILNLAIQDTDEICRLLAYGALPLAGQVGVFKVRRSARSSGGSCGARSAMTFTR